MVSVSSSTLIATMPWDVQAKLRTSKAMPIPAALRASLMLSIPEQQGGNVQCPAPGWIAPDERAGDAVQTRSTISNTAVVA